MKQEGYYTTTDTMLAAYLHAKGVEFIEATAPSSSDARRKAFVMINDTRITSLVEEYYDNNALIDARTYADSLQVVRRFLKNTVELNDK